MDTEPGEPAADERRDTDDGSTIRLTLTPRSLAYVTAAITVAITAAAIVSSAERAFFWIGLGLLLGLALDPLVRALQRRGRSRRGAGFLVGFSILVVGVALVVLVGPPAADQARDFQEELPETIQGFYDLPVVGDWLEKNEVERKVDEFVEDLPSRIDDETVSDTLDSLLGGALSTVLVLAVAFAVMLDGENLVRRARNLIPERRRESADRIGRILYQTFGNYFGGSLTVAVMSGAYVLTLGLIFGVPLAPIAGIWSMITNPIPQIGGFLGGSFVTVLALSVSVPTGIAVGVLFVIYMNFENNVIQPAVIGEAVDLSPPTTMLAALVGGAAAGVPGALVATPLIGTTKRLYLEARGISTKTEGRPSLGDRFRALRDRIGSRSD